MTRVVLVHGIGQQLKGPRTLLEEWYPAMCDGLWVAGSKLAPEETLVAFYGDIFRSRVGRSLGGPVLDASDITDPVEIKWLQSWWEEAARCDPAVSGPTDASRIRTPYQIQRALDALSHSAFFAGLSEHLMISSVRQVRRYLSEPQIRQAVQNRVVDCITGDTRVVVAHSLGSVVAYEALCKISERDEISFITLGSPLGIRHLIFDRLDPLPVNGKGCWPSSVAQWTNIADLGDIVALTKKLAPAFGERVTDRLVHNGSKAHDARPYLTAHETGQAIAEGIR
jgi:hypothetical protein